MSTKINQRDRKRPEFYYDARAGNYWLRLDKGPYLRMSGQDLIDHLRLAQIKGLDKEDDFGLSANRRELALCRQHRSVDYAGPLAGHPIGTFTTAAGQQVLVTSAARPVVPKKGPWPNLARFFDELLQDQAPFAFYWLKLALASLDRHDFRPGQMLVLAGPSGCGKSLFQSLITEMLGGRMAKPYSYMVGDTAFNSHIAAAEHLVIADEQASLDIRSRRNFGASVKDLTVNLEMAVHAKGRDITVTVPTFKRVSLSVNDEPENLAILPPMDESILDKIALLKCSRAQVGSDRLKTWSALTAELPAMAAAVERMKIPATIQDDRYGIQAYHDKTLLEVVSEISPEARLLALIEQVIFQPQNGEDIGHFRDRINGGWHGTAMDLERDLRNSAFAFAVDRLFSFSGACGTYLARLRSKFPARFGAEKNHTPTVWTIGHK